MIRALYLGDPHVQVSNLEESERLMHFLNDKILELKPDKVVILGDLFHTMAIVRAEVLDFWNNWLETLCLATELIVLVGNHDQISRTYQSIHALSVFSRIKDKNFKLIDIPRICGTHAYLPYIHDGESFIKIANELASQGAKVLNCHQTITGSTFETGFFAPDGIDPDKLNFDLIISGHIHARQRFGKVIYPGTARWLVSSDANHPKGLWAVDFDDSDNIISEKYIDTSHVCTPIVSYTWIEGEAEPMIQEGSRATVELIGSSDWISKKKITLKGKASIKSKITDQKRSIERKAGNSLENFLANLYVSTMDRESLLKYAKEIGIV